MHGEERVNVLIAECKKSGKIMREQVKGLSDEELHTLIDNVVKAGTTGKAIVHNGLKEHI